MKQAPKAWTPRSAIIFGLVIGVIAGLGNWDQAAPVASSAAKVLASLIGAVALSIIVARVRNRLVFGREIPR